MPQDIGYGTRAEIAVVRKEGGKLAYQITYYPKGNKDEYVEPQPIIYDDLDEGAISKLKSFLKIKRVIVSKKLRPAEVSR